MEIAFGTLNPGLLLNPSNTVYNTFAGKP